jgi:hypothetical protein
MALAKERNTPERDGRGVAHPMKEETRVFAGALVALDADGWALPGATATGLTAAGRAAVTVDNRDGGNGAASVLAERGVFQYRNHGGDAVTRACIGHTCYIVDDETVAKTSGRLDYPA